MPGQFQYQGLAEPSAAAGTAETVHADAWQCAYPAYLRPTLRLTDRECLDFGEGIATTETPHPDAYQPQPPVQPRPPRHVPDQLGAFELAGVQFVAAFEAGWQHFYPDWLRPAPRLTDRECLDYGEGKFTVETQHADVWAVQASEPTRPRKTITYFLDRYEARPLKLDIEQIDWLGDAKEQPRPLKHIPFQLGDFAFGEGVFNAETPHPDAWQHAYQDWSRPLPRLTDEVCAEPLSPVTAVPHIDWWEQAVESPKQNRRLPGDAWFGTFAAAISSFNPSAGFPWQPTSEPVRPVKRISEGYASGEWTNFTDIYFVRSTSADLATVNSVDPGNPSVLATDVLVAILHQEKAGSFPGTFTPPAGWTPILALTTNSGGKFVRTATYVALGSVASTNFLTTDTLNTGMVISAFRNVSTQTPIDSKGAGASSAGSTTLTSLSFNTATDRAMEIIGTADVNNGQFTAPGFGTQENAAVNQAVALLFANAVTTPDGATGATVITDSASATGQIITSVSFALRWVSAVFDPSLGFPWIQQSEPARSLKRALYGTGDFAFGEGVFTAETITLDKWWMEPADAARPARRLLGESVLTLGLEVAKFESWQPVSDFPMRPRHRLADLSDSVGTFVTTFSPVTGFPWEQQSEQPRALKHVPYQLGEFSFGEGIVTAETITVDKWYAEEWMVSARGAHVGGDVHGRKL